MSALTKKEKLEQVVNNNTTPLGKLFDYTTQGFILASLLCFSLSTLPNISDASRTFLVIAEEVFTIIFSIEYALRVYVAKRKGNYVFSFYGIIDFIAILPLYLNLAIGLFGISSSVSLTALRVFRIFRVFRALKLVRYNRALNRFTIAARIIKEEVILFLIVTAIFLFLASAGIYFFESPVQPETFSSIFSSGWWAIVTLTTVGYGDVYPITVGGKLFTFAVLMVGVGIVTIPAGLVASSLQEARKIEAEELKEKAKQAAEIEDGD